ncbi:hypothetical protein ERJ75_001066000 [Trypanosoma vivax]|nr:hypothetical protein ERJ75_001066000 [Trypanosoma vivax]
MAGRCGGGQPSTPVKRAKSHVETDIVAANGLARFGGHRRKRCRGRYDRGACPGDDVWHGACHLSLYIRLPRCVRARHCGGAGLHNEAPCYLIEGNKWKLSSRVNRDPCEHPLSAVPCCAERWFLIVLLCLDRIASCAAVVELVPALLSHVRHVIAWNGCSHAKE